MNRLASILAMSAALGLASSAVQAATIDECRALVTTANGVVEKDTLSFTSNKRIQQCEVKVVLPSAKGKPTTTTTIIAREMTQDECSMYNYLSSVDSKLNQGKLFDAYNVITDMIGKIATLNSTGKLAEPGNTEIGNAARDVQACVDTLIKQ